MDLRRAPGAPALDEPVGDRLARPGPPRADPADIPGAKPRPIGAADREVLAVGARECLVPVRGHALDRLDRVDADRLIGPAVHRFGFRVGIRVEAEPADPRW